MNGLERHMTFVMSIFYLSALTNLRFIGYNGTWKQVNHGQRTGAYNEYCCEIGWIDTEI